MLQNIYKDSITMIPKPDKDTTRKEIRPISPNNIDIKSLTKYYQTKFNSIIKGSFTTAKWDLYLGCKDGVTYVNLKCDTPYFLN